jgi:hypothetical protein
MPSAMLLMLIVKLKQVLFYSLNRNIHSRSGWQVYEENESWVNCYIVAQLIIGNDTGVDFGQHLYRF